MISDEKLALHNCDKEPVHIPGRIQSFAAVVAFEIISGEVKYLSDNLATMFPDLPSPQLGMSLETLFVDRPIIHAIRGSLGLPTIKTTRDRIGVFEMAGHSVDVSVFEVDGMAVVELEPADRHAREVVSSVATVRAMLSVLETGRGLTPLLDSAVNSLRHATGFDRVMAYRFLQNDEGEVVSEAKGPGIESFLGLRYPAFDIPLQVRQIMLRAPFRLIQDIHDPHSSIIRESDVPRLDLTLSHLRGVSPIHIEYLENMGVYSTMNISIIVRGKLWGIFAFHHYRKRRLGPDRRSICELFGQLVSMQIYQELEQLSLARRQRTQSIMSALKTSGNSIEEIFPQLAMEFADIVRANGAALVSADDVSAFGETPDENAIRLISEMSQDNVFYLDSLSSTIAGNASNLRKTAGALVVRLDDEQSVLFFRDEIIHEVRWAGSPKKNLTLGANGPRLSPRGSFGEYKESVEGLCDPWREGDVTAANEICRDIFRLAYPASRQVNREWEKQKRYQDLLIAELNHRVRNTLALTHSIIRQTESSESSLSTYVNALERRIATLAQAHDLIGGSGLQWARIEDLVVTELRPFENLHTIVSSRGPAIAVRADVAPIVSLLIHELTSNAAKHGALSPDGKSLDVCWEMDGGGVSIRWKEVLGSPIEQPTSRGFGLALIERAVPYECDGKSSISFEGNELNVHFWLPGSAIQHLSKSDVRKRKVKPPAELDSNRKLGLKTVLIVEDNMILAMEMEKMLAELGSVESDAHSDPETAAEAIDRIEFDAAVLDINLGSSDSFGLARILLKKQVPFVFVSGYDSSYVIPDELLAINRLTKPVTKAALAVALEAAHREIL